MTARYKPCVSRSLTRFFADLFFNALPMNPPLAVIFDMDGVLVDTYHAHYESWLMMAKREGLHFTEAEFGATFGRTSREIIAHFWGARRFNDAEIAALDGEKEAAFREIIAKDFPAMPGAKQLLVALHENGFKLAVGSSGPPENVAMVIDKLDASHLFGAVVTGMDVTRGKPDPQVFLLAAERLGVLPSCCVVVEDARPGIQAAHSAGMKAIGLVSTGRTREELAEADFLAATLEGLSAETFRRLLRESPASA
jgi:beta-phosphoglucomutase